MHHKSRFLESVRWTSSTAGTAVSGFRTGWSDFGRDLCIVMIVMWLHQTKTSFFSYWTTMWLDWRFDLRFCLRYGEFSFFFVWVNVLQNATTDGPWKTSKGTTPRNDLDGPGLWLEPDDAVSILRNPRTPCFSLRWKISTRNRHKAGGKRWSDSQPGWNFQGSGNFEVSEASEESEDSWWPERPTPQQVGSSVFFFGGEFFEARFWRPPGCIVFFKTFCHAWQSICKAHWTGP